MDIEFCECGGMLLPAEKGMQCRNCGRTVEKTAKSTIKTEGKKDEIVVIENNEPDLPATDKECQKCGHNRAYYWLIQTRSSDEPPTQFFRCVKCKYVWREYK